MTLAASSLSPDLIASRTSLCRASQVSAIIETDKIAHWIKSGATIGIDDKLAAI